MHINALLFFLLVLSIAKFKITDIQIYAVVTDREVCCAFTFLLTNFKRKDIDSMVKLRHT